MIGRAALGQPWLVGDIAVFSEQGRRAARAVPAAVRRDAALEHYRSSARIFGETQGLRHARKHLAAYARCRGRQGGGLDATRRAGDW